MGSLTPVYYVQVEATDLADALHLKERLEGFLKTSDHGDWSGRRVVMIGTKVRETRK